MTDLAPPDEVPAQFPSGLVPPQRAPGPDPAAAQPGKTYALHETTLVLASEAQRRVWGDRAVRQWSMPRGWTYERSIEISRQCEKLVGADEGRRLVWVLVPRDNPQGLEILSATRTFKRDAKIMRKASGEVERVTSYVITGVITPAEYRKRGYARHMLRLLHYCIALPASLPPFPVDAWGAPPPASAAGANDATFSTLWSAVGPDFYRKALIGDGERARDGWVKCYDQEVTLEVGAGGGDGGAAEAAPQRTALDRLLADGWTLQDRIPEGPPPGAAAHEVELLAAALTGNTTVAALDSLESPGQLPWNMLKHQLGTPPGRAIAHSAWGFRKGADADAAAGAAASWVFFSCAIAGNKPTMLTVTHIHLADPGEMPLVLDALVEHGRNMQATSISVFELARELLPAWERRGARRVDRDDHLGAMAWYGAEPAEAVKALAGQQWVAVRAGCRP